MDNLTSSNNELSSKENIVRQEAEGEVISQFDDLHSKTFARCDGNLAALSPDKPSSNRVCNYFNKIPKLTIILNQVKGKEQQQMDDSTSTLSSPDSVSPATVCKYMHDRKQVLNISCFIYDR